LALSTIAQLATVSY